MTYIIFLQCQRDASDSRGAAGEECEAARSVRYLGVLCGGQQSGPWAAREGGGSARGATAEVPASAHAEPSTHTGHHRGQPTQEETQG